MTLSFNKKNLIHKNQITLDNKTKIERISAACWLYFKLTLFILVPILNVWWTPLFTPSIGGSSNNVTPLDLLLLMAWLSVGLTSSFSKKESFSQQERLAWDIVFWANAPLILSPLATLVMSNGDNLIGGILAHLKRVGLASIIVPLAVQTYKPWRIGLITISLLIASILLFRGPSSKALYTLSILNASGRNTSILFNPNILAFVVTLHILILISLAQTKTSYIIKAASILGILASFMPFVTAGSRSVTIALLGAILYYVWVNHLPRWLIGVTITAIIITLSLVGSGLLNYFEDSIFIFRWQRFLQYGLEEANVAGRLDAQQLAVSQFIFNPIGLGINSEDVLHTDSIFFDYLSSMGFLGLLSIIRLFQKSWQAQSIVTIETITAKAVILCTVIFSSTALGLASNFGSPLYFLAIGLGLSSTTFDSSNSNCGHWVKDVEENHHARY